MSTPPRQLRRRTTLVLAAAGLLGAAGCGSASRPGDQVRSAGSATDPDDALLDQVLAELGAAWQTATAGGLTDLARLHRTHIAALDGTLPRRTRTAVTTPVARQREHRLQAFLVESAMTAQSGSLARMLASMAAAVSQRLTVLEGTP